MDKFSFLTSIRLFGFSQYLWMDVVGPVEGDPNLVEIACVSSSCPHVDDDCLSDDAKNFLAFSIAKSVHSLTLSVSMISVCGDSWVVRISSTPSPVFLITNWGDDYLMNRNDTQQHDPVGWLSKLFPSLDFESCSDLVDLMTCICMRRREALERVPTETKHVPDLLVGWAASGEAVRDPLEAFLWTEILFPSHDELFNSKSLTDMINGASLPRDHMWSVHRRLEAAMKRGTMTEVVSIIQAGKLPDPDRLKVYAFLLGCEPGPSTVPGDVKLHPKRPFDTRFKSLVAQQRCGWEPVSEKFRHRIVLHSKEDSLNLLRKYLNVMDPPLLDLVDRAPFDMNMIIDDIFACTSLCDDQLLSLWDVLMVSPPDTLIKVLVFVLIEMRELIMQDVENLGNVLLCVGDLVENFPELVNIALSESTLD